MGEGKRMLRKVYGEGDKGCYAGFKRTLIIVIKGFSRRIIREYMREGCLRS